MKRVAWRLMPLLLLGYFSAYLDRSNVGMAALTMNKDLGFSNAVFGFGAGLFFIGYFIGEVPSNLVLNKFGARRWIARIMITWGIISGLTACVWDEWSFYTVRLLLGLAEAGLYPGVLLYMSWWVPSYYRTRSVALFQSASLISMIIGPPIGGLLLHLQGTLGLAGWQWLFIVEALPSLIMCVMIWQFLTERPDQATWLRPDQRKWLSERVASERAEREAIRKYSLAETFYSLKIWLMAVAYIGQNMVSYALAFFMPLIVQGLGASTGMIGVVAALPYVFALIAMNYWGWHSDVTGERIWHVCGAYLLSAAGLVACALLGHGHPVLTMIALTLALSGAQAINPTILALPGAMLTGAAAAAGFAMVCATGNLGGLIGPWVFGLVKDATGSDSTAALVLALGPIIAVILLQFVGYDRRMERFPPRAPRQV
jgi:MFS family permease